MPLISVIVPTCNRPHLLKRALMSISGQSFGDFEVIIVNDAGCDVSPVVAEFNDPRFVLINLTVKQGQSCRNEAFAVARGRYIAYLDDDDLYYPHHLSTVADVIHRCGCSFVYTGCTTVHETPEGTELQREPRVYPPYHPSLIKRDTYIPICSILHEKNLLDRAGMFDPELEFAEDWDLWFRFSRFTRLYHVNEYTTEYRKRITAGNNINSIQKTSHNAASIDVLRFKKHGIITDLRTHYNGTVPDFVIDNLNATLRNNPIYIYGAGSFFRQIYPRITVPVAGIFDAHLHDNTEFIDAIPALRLEHLSQVRHPILSTAVGRIRDVLLTASKYTSCVDRFLFLDDFFDQPHPAITQPQHNFIP